MKFVIEHLEPELFEWCLIEYSHISKIVGKENLIFTNVSKKDSSKLKRFGRVFNKKLSELNFKNLCVLDQYSDAELNSKDKDNFDYFVFGGILGDNPARKRTHLITDELKKSRIHFETRNLGSKQMPTDVAAYAAKRILEGKKINEFRFIDEVEIGINENEAVNLPFRYIIENNRLVISEKLVEFLRKRKEF